MVFSRDFAERVQIARLAQKAAEKSNAVNRKIIQAARRGDSMAFLDLNDEQKVELEGAGYDLLPTSDGRTLVSWNAAVVEIDGEKNASELNVAASGIIYVKEGGKLICDSALETNGTLYVYGEGEVFGDNNGSCFIADGEGAQVVIDGCKGTCEGATYYCYGKDGGKLVLLSGEAECFEGSVLGGNATTGAAHMLVKGGVWKSQASFAVYQATEGIVEIQGGEVEGVNSRGGTLYVEDEAKLTTPRLVEDADDAESNLKTSGCVWFNECEVALFLGTNKAYPKETKAVIADGNRVRVIYAGAVDHKLSLVADATQVIEEFGTASLTLG